MITISKLASYSAVSVAYGVKVNKLKYIAYRVNKSDKCI